MPFKNKLPILVLSSALVVSCGKGGGGSSSGKSSSALEDAQEGTYKAILRPLNIHLSGFIPTGVAEIKIVDSQVDVKTLLDDDAKVPHMQSIHIGKRCPNASDDKNNDGLVDMQEALKASGNVFVPLDSNLNSVDEGKGIYPMGGGFTYQETTSLEKFGYDLKLNGRVVLIHGVAEATPLPPGVRANEVPIVCGILKKI